MALRDYLDVSTRAELYTFVMQSDQALLVLGITTAGDIPAEVWYFDATSMAVDNGVTVIKATATPVGNPGRYIRGIQESAWSSTTGKPTTLSGYGITDAYPLSGNPSSFLTGITSGQVTSALGFTPYNNTNPNSYISAAGVTSSVINAALGYVPLNPTRTLTINGVTQDLSANRTWTIDGSETKVTAGANVAVTGSGTVASPYVVSASAAALSFATPSRALNSNFTISSTRNAQVAYTVRIAYTITILLGSTGTATLQYSTDAGSTWISVSAVSNNLNLGIALTGYNDFLLSGVIPANALVRVATTATNATVTIRPEQQEVLL